MRVKNINQVVTKYLENKWNKRFRCLSINIFQETETYILAEVIYG